MPKVKCRTYLDDLQNFTNAEIPLIEIAKNLISGGVSKQKDVKKVANSISNRIYNDGYFNDEEKKVLDKIYKLGEIIEVDNDCTNLPIRGDVSASMGYGITIYDETQTGTYAISNKLAKDINANLKESDIIFAKGDSMEPTIMGGDSLLVDKSKRNIYDGRIYCIRYEGDLYAKRLQKVPPTKIKVVSDNQAKYDSWYVDYSKDINFDFEVIGEILWWGRVAK